MSSALRFHFQLQASPPTAILIKKIGIKSTFYTQKSQIAAPRVPCRDSQSCARQTCSAAFGFSMNFDLKSSPGGGTGHLVPLRDSNPTLGPAGWKLHSQSSEFGTCRIFRDLHDLEFHKTKIKLFLQQGNQTQTPSSLPHPGILNFLYFYLLPSD